MQAKNKHVAAAGLAGLVIGSAGVAGAASNIVLHDRGETVSYGAVECMAVREWRQDAAGMLRASHGRWPFRDGDKIITCGVPRKWNVYFGASGAAVLDSRSRFVFARSARSTSSEGAAAFGAAARRGR